MGVVVFRTMIFPDGNTVDVEATFSDLSTAKLHMAQVVEAYHESEFFIFGALYAMSWNYVDSKYGTRVTWEDGRIVGGI